MRTQGKLGSFVFVEYRHVINRHMGFFGQERDDSLLIWLLVVREHLGVLNLAEFLKSLARQQTGFCATARLAGWVESASDLF